MISNLYTGKAFSDYIFRS